jgi:hypothetical protein
VDISPEQIAIARSKGLKSAFVGDFRGWLVSSSIVVIVATDFFEHLARVEILAAVDTMRAALRGRGRVIARVPNAVSPFSGNYQYGDLTHETLFTARSMRQLARATGFASVDIHECPPPVHGWRSGLRLVLWTAAALGMKATLAAETGALRGHYVTQNILVVLHAP